MIPGGPRFEPHDGAAIEPRVRRIEDWAGRHDQWSHQAAREAEERANHHGDRLARLEEKMTRVLASIGEHRLKWGIVAWIVGVAAAAAIAWMGSR